MENTYRKVQKDQIIDSGPTKYDVFRSKAKSISHGAAIDTPKFEFGGRHKSIAADPSSSEMQEYKNYADSKYLIQLNEINDQSHLA